MLVAGVVGGGGAMSFTTFARGFACRRRAFHPPPPAAAAAVLRPADPSYDTGPTPRELRGRHTAVFPLAEHASGDARF